MNYKAYLQSDEWKEKRKRFLSHKNKKNCFVCGDGHSRLDIHHGNYRKIGKETCCNVFAVCRPCHDLVHALVDAFGLHPRTAVKKASGKIRKLAKRWKCPRFRVAQKVRANPGAHFKKEAKSYAYARQIRGDLEVEAKDLWAEGAQRRHARQKRWVQ